MKNKKNENGAISIFVILSMMFFLVSVLGIFKLISNTNITQSSTLSELKKIYAKEPDDIYESKIAKQNEEIPIYNEEQFLKIGSGDLVEINGRVYEFGDPDDGYNYVLKDNVVLDLVHYTDFYRYNEYMDIFKNSAYKISYYYPVDNFEELYWNLAYAKNENNAEQYNILNSLDDNKIYKVIIFYDNQEPVITKTAFDSTFINQIRSNANSSDNCLILIESGESNLTNLEKAVLARNRMEEVNNSDFPENMKDNDNIRAVISGSGGIVPIPKDCTYIDGSNNESSNSYGIVIQDSNENEWVWVPVPDATVMYETSAPGIALSGDTGVKTYKYSKSRIISQFNRNITGTTSWREPDLITDSDTDSNASTYLTNAEF